MTLETSKTLGGIGALLMVIGPFLGVYTGLLGLIGLIFVLIAVKGFSDHYKEPDMFNNALYGVIAAIIGGVVCIGVIVIAAVGFLSALGIEISALGDWAILQNVDWSAIATWDLIWPHIAAIFGALVVLFIFGIVAAFFMRRSLTLLSEKTGVNLFNTAGLLILLGAVLTIVAVGVLIVWVALILLIVSFFTIKIQSAEPSVA